VPMKQLAQFETTRNRIWFTRPGTYWFARVWGAQRSVTKAQKSRLQRYQLVKR
jgi:hypothetical protein